MSIKISELPVATSVNPTDIVPIVQDGETKQTDMTKMSNANSLPVGATFQYDGSTIPTGYVEVNGFENYSTTEQKIGTWVDGKPLYQVVKYANAPNVITAGTFVASTTNHNIANVDTIFISTAYDQTATEHINLPYMTNAGYNIKATVSRTAIAISSNATNFNGHTYLFVLKYTKTTD